MSTPAGGNPGNSSTYPYSPDNPFQDWYPQRNNPNLDHATNEAIFIAFQDIYALRRHVTAVTQPAAAPAVAGGLGGGGGGGAAAGGQGIVTFGLDADYVGTNTPQHYGNIEYVGSPIHASISCVVPPTTAPAIFDVLFSHDNGLTWTSIFVSGNPFRYPTTAIGLVQFAGVFAAVAFAVGDILRVDTVQSGGAFGITGVVRWA